MGRCCVRHVASMLYVAVIVGTLMLPSCATSGLAVPARQVETAESEGDSELRPRPQGDSSILPSGLDPKARDIERSLGIK